MELKPGGSQIPVTESNKKEYLDLLAQYRLSSSVKQEIEAFAKGNCRGGGFEQRCFLNLNEGNDSSHITLVTCNTVNVSTLDVRFFTLRAEALRSS